MECLIFTKERQLELVAGQEIWDAWPFVTLTYSLLEQSLKALVSKRDSTYGKDEMKDDGHSLIYVYKRLPDSDKERMQKAYRAYQSLHHYIETEEIKEFLTFRDKEGKTVTVDPYVEWRYVLLEGWSGKIWSKTSPEALLEIARQALDILQNAVTGQEKEIRTVGDRLNDSLRVGIRRKSCDCLSGEEGEWKTLRGSNHINMVSVCLRAANLSLLQGKVEYDTEGRFDEVRYITELASLFGEEFPVAMREFMDSLSERSNPNIRQFVGRAIEERYGPRYFFWDEQERVFTTVDDLIELDHQKSA